MLETCKKDSFVFEEISQLHWNDKIFYLLLQSDTSITCLGLPENQIEHLQNLQTPK